MFKEPKAKNVYQCPPRSWKLMTEKERHFYNKFFAYASIRIEEFSDKSVENWEKVCRKMALLSLDVNRRGANAIYASK